MFLTLSGEALLRNIPNRSERVVKMGKDREVACLIEN